MKIDDLIVSKDVSIVEAAKQLEKTRGKVLYVAENYKLLGSLTDGDIRRAIAEKKLATVLVKDIMNCQCIRMKENQDDEIKEIFETSEIYSIPIVNLNGELIKVRFRDKQIEKKQYDIGIPLVIMAGGKGTRLYPYTKILPKALVPIGEIPIAEHIINRFQKYGCKDVYLIVNHKKEMIRSYFESINYRLNYVNEEIPLGTGGGIALLENFKEEEFFLSNCDILIDADYEKIYKTRFQILEKAFSRFGENDEYRAFVSENQFWLEDYSLYMAIKDRNGGVSWNEWEEPLKNKESQAIENAKAELSRQIAFYKFQQYEFDRQWKRLRSYANENGIEIIGDIPIYVAFDSADTWSAPEMFRFNDALEPIDVAGCPPDGFSQTGQLWGNPLYDWEYHKKTGYDWWIRRIEHCFRLYDVVRIDHFRGFDEYYAVPYGEKTAVHGKWMPGPGIELFRTLEEKIGRKRIIAEDLGFLTPSVIQLLKESGFPGMKVLQFAFDSREDSNYLPHTYTRNCVVYTGTHDNDTTKGWYHTAAGSTRQFAKEYMYKPRLDEDTLAGDFIAMAMGSAADLCIVPMQDYLGLGSDARINTPSTLGGNWEWRMKPGEPDEGTVREMERMTKIYGRLRFT